MTISSSYSNPLAGRRAWSGNSGGFVTTTVNLPATTAGHDIQLRWRLGTDTSRGAAGWYVDTVAILDGATCCLTLLPPLIVDTRMVGPGSLAFSYDSLAGQTYIVQAATNITGTNWTSLQTNTGDGSLQSYTNSTIPLGGRFFRLRSQ